MNATPTGCQRLKTDVNHQHLNKSFDCSSVTFSLEQFSLKTQFRSSKLVSCVRLLWHCRQPPTPPPTHPPHIWNLIYLIAPVQGLLIRLPLTPSLENVDTQSKDWPKAFLLQSFLWAKYGFFLKVLTLHKVFEPQMIFIGLGIGGMHPSAVYNVHQMSCMCRVRPQFSLSIHVDTKFDSTSFHYILGIYKLINIKFQDKLWICD